MCKAAISTKSFHSYNHLAFKPMPPGWGSQQILSTPPQPMWDTNNTLIQGCANIGG